MSGTKNISKYADWRRERDLKKRGEKEKEKENVEGTRQGSERKQRTGMMSTRKRAMVREKGDTAKKEKRSNTGDETPDIRKLLSVSSVPSEESRRISPRRKINSVKITPSTNEKSHRREISRENAGPPMSVTERRNRIKRVKPQIVQEETRIGNQFESPAKLPGFMRNDLPIPTSGRATRSTRKIKKSHSISAIRHSSSTNKLQETQSHLLQISFINAKTAEVISSSKSQAQNMISMVWQLISSIKMEQIELLHENRIAKQYENLGQNLSAQYEKLSAVQDELLKNNAQYDQVSEYLNSSLSLIPLENIILGDNLGGTMRKSVEILSSLCSKMLPHSDSWAEIAEMISEFQYLLEDNIKELELLTRNLKEFKAEINHERSLKMHLARLNTSL